MTIEEAVNELVVFNEAGLGSGLNQRVVSAMLPHAQALAYNDPGILAGMAAVLHWMFEQELLS